MAISPYKMKAGKEGPMKKNFPSAFKKDTDTDKVVVAPKTIDPFTGNMNSTGTKIINTEGNWIDSSSVKGKQLRQEYGNNNYSNSKLTPNSDLANTNTKIIKE